MKQYNNLKGSCCYLAGNLENVSDDYSSNWRALITKGFAKLDILCLDPKSNVLQIKLMRIANQ